MEIVINNGNKPITSSRIIAQIFGKRHDDVLKAIRNLECSSEFSLRNFAETPYTNEQNGQVYHEFIITRDGFSFLAMGFTGSEAAKFKEAFITAFNKMEAQLMAALPAIPQTFAAALRQLAAEVEAREIAEKEKEVAQLQLEEAKPKVEFYDAVTDSTDAVDLGTAAKVLNLGFGRTTLFEKLRDNKILMKNNQPFQKYIDAGWFRVIETSWTHPNGDTHVNFKTVVYQKGLDGIRKVLSTENF